VLVLMRRSSLFESEFVSTIHALETAAQTGLPPFSHFCAASYERQLLLFKKRRSKATGTLVPAAVRGCLVGDGARDEVGQARYVSSRRTSIGTREPCDGLVAEWPKRARSSNTHGALLVAS